VYCTRLRASWSELAYVLPLYASETETFWLCVAWVVVINKRRRPRNFVIWRAGCV
jgi:hypothetical protein